MLLFQDAYLFMCSHRAEPSRQKFYIRRGRLEGGFPPVAGGEFAMKQEAIHKARHLFSLSDLTKEELEEIILLGQTLKAGPEKFRDSLSRKTLIMLFQKTSTRTRLSFEAGMARLGGHAIYLDWAKSNYTLGDLKDE